MDAYVQYRLGAEIARRLPRPLGAGARTVGTSVFERRADESRFLVERNLRRVHGPSFGGAALHRAVHQSFSAYARYWYDSARLPDLTPAEIDAGFGYDGFEHIEDGVAAGRGTILALPHLGGWEWAGAWLAQIPRYRVIAVVEPQQPPELFEWMVATRRSYGLEIVPVGPGAGTELLAGLRDNAVICLLSDRNVGHRGIEVEFFGETTVLPSGAATLALRTGAAIVPVAVYHRGRGHHAVCRRPVPAEREGRLRDDVHRVTRDVVRELEVLIRAAPEQWHLMQPNWPSDHAALAARRASVPMIEPDRVGR